MPHPQPACAVCGRSGPIAAFSKYGYAVWRCPDCDFRFVHPLPADTASIYDGGYFQGATRGFGYIDYDADKIAMRPFFRAVLDAIEAAREGRRGRLLDVGAATGFFLKMASERGWRADGIEVSEHAAEQAIRSGIRMHVGTLETAEFEDASYDAITMLDVIEHIGDPGGAVRRAKRLLAPGGVLAVNTPDTASWWARLWDAKWHAYCPPEHLAYFNQRNLSALLSGNGFSVVRTEKIGKRFTPAYIVSMLGRWTGSALFVRAALLLEGSAANRISLPVHIRDNFFMIARTP